MDYKVKIIAKDGAEILLGHNEDKDTIKKVDIKFDTLEDDVVSKSAGMLARMTIEGDVKTEGENIDKLMALFEWSKSQEADEWYRTVEVEISNGGQRLRAYHFEQMFVVDYEEIYDNTTKSQTNTKFILTMTQKENNFDKAKTYK